MLLTLCRKPSTEHYTEGELFLGEQKLCDTLEDVVRPIKSRADKVIGYTAIPKGKYRVLWTFSPVTRDSRPNCNKCHGSQLSESMQATQLRTPAAVYWSAVRVERDS